MPLVTVFISLTVIILNFVMTRGFDIIYNLHYVSS